MLIEGSDYLFFRSAYHSGGAITGLKNAEVAVVATRRFLFLVPIRETSLGLATITVARHAFLAGHGTLGVGEALAQYLASPGLALATLEAELHEFLGGKLEYVVELDALASLTIWSRFLRQVRFKQPRKATQVLALRGKANHERFRSFYAEAVERRAAS